MSSFYSDMIYEKILEAENEAVFIATDFLDIADYETARKALNRLDSYGKIKKICRGVYYNPKFSELLGEYEAPSPHNVALALARKFNWNIAPSGNTALNQLGLSTQVTAHWTYISDGPYNKFTIGNIEIDFKHRSNKEISGMSYTVFNHIFTFCKIFQGELVSGRNILVQDNFLAVYYEFFTGR